MRQRDASHCFLGVSTDAQSDARPADAQPLWQLGQTECEALLAAFVDMGFLRRTRGEAFIRTESGTVAA